MERHENSPLLFKEEVNTNRPIDVARQAEHIQYNTLSLKDGWLWLWWFFRGGGFRFRLVECIMVIVWYGEKGGVRGDVVEDEREATFFLF